MSWVVLNSEHTSFQIFKKNIRWQVSLSSSLQGGVFNSLGYKWLMWCYGKYLYSCLRNVINGKLILLYKIINFLLLESMLFRMEKQLHFKYSPLFTEEFLIINISHFLWGKIKLHYPVIMYIQYINARTCVMSIFIYTCIYLVITGDLQITYSHYDLPTCMSPLSSRTILRTDQIAN